MIIDIKIKKTTREQRYYTYLRKIEKLEEDYKQYDTKW